MSQREVDRKRKRHTDASVRRVSADAPRMKRRKSDQLTFTNYEEVNDPPKFQQLKPRTREISHAVVKSKWASLPAPAQQQVRQLLKTAQRPVILAQRNERRRAEIETTLDTLVKKLERRVPRMPFPPRTKDFHFDLDKLLERNRSLENHLTPANHSLDLLRASIEQEQQALVGDRAILASLEANAKAEERQQRQQITKTHPRLKQLQNLTEGHDDADSINLVEPRHERSVHLDDEDADLQPLLQTLRSHLESMRNNSAQLNGIEDAMAAAFATLDGALQHATIS